MGQRSCSCREGCILTSTPPSGVGSRAHGDIQQLWAYRTPHSASSFDLLLRTLLVTVKLESVTPNNRAPVWFIFSTVSNVSNDYFKNLGGHLAARRKDFSFCSWLRPKRLRVTYILTPYMSCTAERFPVSWKYSFMACSDGF